MTDDYWMKYVFVVLWNSKIDEKKQQNDEKVNFQNFSDESLLKRSIEMNNWS